MIFWLFSGLLQKSGAAMRFSISLSFVCCLEASKIPPHGERLIAEGKVFPFELFD
jgi:hypothetical protein